MPSSGAVKVNLDRAGNSKVLEIPESWNAFQGKLQTGFEMGGGVEGNRAEKRWRSNDLIVMGHRNAEFGD